MVKGVAHVLVKKRCLQPTTPQFRNRSRAAKQRNAVMNAQHAGGARFPAVFSKKAQAILACCRDGTDILVTAQRLDSSKIVCGLSNKLTADEQAKLTGDAWERLPEPHPRLELDVVSPDGESSAYSLGPHTPRLRPEDLELLHKIWLEITSNPEYRGLHHYHVVALALRELERELKSGNRDHILELIQNEMIYDAESKRWRADRNSPSS